MVNDFRLLLLLLDMGLVRLLHGDSGSIHHSLRGASSPWLSLVAEAIGSTSLVLFAFLVIWIL